MEPNRDPSVQLMYYRLVALWVICEALLGGIIHGLRLPISGLVVGSSAVICISLLAWFVPNRGAILKATIIVAVFKMMLSPHSPIPAYFAVFFQGILGAILFSGRKRYFMTCVLFATLALLESGLQRILVMTILYGNELWDAINTFLSRFTNEDGHYSEWMIVAYLSMHLVAGILTGIFCGRLPSRLSVWKKSKDLQVTVTGDGGSIKPKRKRKWKTALLVSWLALVLLLLQSYLQPAQPILPSDTILQLLIRSFIILVGWYVIVSPLLTAALKYWLNLQHKRIGPDISIVLQLLPATKQVVEASWKLSAATKGFRRLPCFFRILLVNTLHHG